MNSTASNQRAPAGGEQLDRALQASLDIELESLLGQLIAANSETPPGDCRAAVETAALWVNSNGLDCEVVAAEEHLPNLILRLGDGHGPNLVWNAHLDTVRAGDRGAWRTDPFAATRVDGEIFGLGAANCKGSAAALLCATLALHRAELPLHGSLVVTLVADEESLGSLGTGYLLESGRIQPDHFLAAGPTGNQLIFSERGLLWVEVEIQGQGAHGAIPSSGRNAVTGAAQIMLTLLEELSPRLAERTADSLPHSSINVGVVRGGESPNMVPPSCVFEIDRRLVPGESPEEALAEIRELVDALATQHGLAAKVQGTRAVSPYQASVDSRLATAINESCKAVGRTPSAGEAIAISDARFVAESGAEIVSFGPGDGRASHGPNESVPLDELREATCVYALSAASMLSEGSDG